MITNYHELKEEIEQLQQKTLPILWQERAIELIVNEKPIDALEIAILLIQKSRNEELKEKAERILDRLIDINVRVNFNL